MGDLTVTELEAIAATRPIRVAWRHAAVTESRRLREACRPRRRPGPPKQHRFPLAPLLTAGQFATYGELAVFAGRSRDAVQCWADRGGVTEPIADELACRLDLHPALIWPEWWTLTPPTIDLDDLDLVAV